MPYEDDFEIEVDLRELSLQQLSELHLETRGDNVGVLIALREQVSERDPLFGELDGTTQLVALAIRSLAAAGHGIDDSVLAAAFGFNVDDLAEARAEIAAAGWQPV